LSVAHPHLVVTDLRMSGMDGMALFRAIHARDPALPVIVLTAHGTIPDAVAATQHGLFGYLTKPYDATTLIDLLKRATRLAGGGPAGAVALRLGLASGTALPGLLQRARGRAGRRPPLARGLQPRLGTGPQAARQGP